VADQITDLCATAPVSCGASGAYGAGGPSTAIRRSSQVVVYASGGKSLIVYGLDTNSGSLEPRQTIANLKNDVHYAAFHPTRKYLYVTCGEIPLRKNRPHVTAVYAFSIDGRTGALTQLGEPFTPPLSRAVHFALRRAVRFGRERFALAMKDARGSDPAKLTPPHPV
jgi:hypothetical protein